MWLAHIGAVQWIPVTLPIVHTPFDKALKQQTKRTKDATNQNINKQQKKSTTKKPGNKGNFRQCRQDCLSFLFAKKELYKHLSDKGELMSWLLVHWNILYLHKSFYLPGECILAYIRTGRTGESWCMCVHSHHLKMHIHRCLRNDQMKR